MSQPETRLGGIEGVTQLFHVTPGVVHGGRDAEAVVCHAHNDIRRLETLGHTIRIIGPEGDDGSSLPMRGQTGKRFGSSCSFRKRFSPSEWPSAFSIPTSLRNLSPS